MPVIPDGDILVHAGDLTMRGSLSEVAIALEWLADLPHQHKIIIAGNHDFAFEDHTEAAQSLVPSNMTYLCDQGTVIAGVHFWGSPYQPEFFDWAFNKPRGEALERIWAQIPEDVNVLVTHGPPHGILDLVPRGRGEHVGCEALRDRLAQLHHLRLHVFGHIHEGYGTVESGGCQFVNASSCTADYEPVNEPIVVDL